MSKSIYWTELKSKPSNSCPLSKHLIFQLSLISRGRRSLNITDFCLLSHYFVVTCRNCLHGAISICSSNLKGSFTSRSSFKEDIYRESSCRVPLFSFVPQLLKSLCRMDCFPWRSGSFTCRGWCTLVWGLQQRQATCNLKLCGCTNLCFQHKFILPSLVLISTC